jgi:hypothetical protein
MNCTATLNSVFVDEYVDEYFRQGTKLKKELRIPETLSSRIGSLAMAMAMRGACRRLVQRSTAIPRWLHTGPLGQQSEEAPQNNPKFTNFGECCNFFGIRDKEPKVMQEVG